MDQNHLNNFGRVSPKDHLCEIISKLDKGEELSFKPIVNRRTDDGRRPITIGHLVNSDR